MFFPFIKKKSVRLKTVTFFLFSFFLITVQAQDNSVLVIKGQTLTAEGKSSLAGSIGARSVKTNDEGVEGVNIEVKKGGATILKTTSGKKGKYSFQIPISTSDPMNDYVVYISKDGFVPKMISINAYLSKNEFANYSSAKYDFEWDWNLLKTTITDIELDKPSAKISWDFLKEHKFSFDMAYYNKHVLKEDQKMIPNPDAYFKNLGKKKKKAEETLSKNKAAADAKVKADEEAKKLAADLKAKEEADRIEREKIEALKKEALKKHIADSLAEAERKKAMEASSAKMEIKKIVKPITEDYDAGKNTFDASETYSINIAKKSLSAEKEKRNKERGKNITAKYETTNTLTSLLNMIDEYDKKLKKQ